MPTKIASRPGARTSGTALSGLVLAPVEALLEAAAQVLPGHRRAAARAAPLELDDTHGVLSARVAPGVALGLREWPQAHAVTLRRLPDGTVHAWRRRAPRSWTTPPPSTAPA